MEEEVILESASFTFSQEGNCVDHSDVEVIEIRCESSLGIDRDGGCFYVLKTDQWTFEDIEDLQKLVNRINKVINKKVEEDKQMGMSDYMKMGGVTLV